MVPTTVNRQRKSLALIKFSSPPKSVRKATKLLAPVLFFFVLLQNCAYLLPLVVEFSATFVDKSYMFILCNGILVLIAKNSGLISNGIDEEGKAAEYGRVMEDEEKLREEEREVVLEGGKEEEEVEEEVVSFITEEVEGDSEQQRNGVVVDEQQEEEQEEEDNGLPSSEELQRKCEDFIRRMRAGIKFEQQQQQQLIMVQ